MSVQRAREAAARGGWEEAYDLLMEADADGLADPGDLRLLGEVAYAAGHLDVTIEACERAHALSRTGRRRCRGGRCSGSRRDAPAAGHRADGAGARLARPSRTASRGSGGDGRARVARGRPRVRADADRRPPGRSAVVRARHRGGLDAATLRRAPSDEWRQLGCASWTAMSRKAWRCSTRWEWRRSPGISIRSPPGWCTASSSAPCRDSRSTTSPRSGPRRWSDGAGRTPSGASMGAAACTARRS